MEVYEGSNQKLDILPHWMAAHVRLKNEFTEDEKCHNLMMAYFFNVLEFCWYVAKLCGC